MTPFVVHVIATSTAFLLPLTTMVPREGSEERGRGGRREVGGGGGGWGEREEREREGGDTIISYV